MRRKIFLFGLIFLIFGLLVSASPVLAAGPLRVHPTNPRYFTDDSGKAIFLTGSHTWSNLQNDDVSSDPPPEFDYCKKGE